MSPTAPTSPDTGLWQPPSPTDLAPMIARQRLIIEGTCLQPITADQISSYLRQLGEVTDMVVLTEPALHESPQYGWAGWVHWETSGAHFYAWDRPLLFFSADIYTCKPFKPAGVIEFTARFFDTTQLVARSL